MGWLDTAESAWRFNLDPADLLGMRSGRRAAEEQLQAQQDALAAQQAEVDRTRGTLGDLMGQGRQDIAGYSRQATDALNGGYGQAQQALAGGYGQAQQTLAGLMGQGNSLRDQMGQPLDLQADPGYQFRQQQGEQAIQRMAAAQGGRLGGGTLKELMNFNSGLASQEYQNAFGRQQAQNAQQLQLLGQQYGLGSTMAGLSAQGGHQSAGLYGQQAGSLAGLLSNTGANLANVNSQYGGNYTSLAQAMMGAQQNYAQYPGMVDQAEANVKGQMVGALGQIGAAFLGKSDIRLKTDLKPMPGSKYELLGLRGWRWRWNAIAERLGLRGEAEGVIAQEVARIIPGAVVRGADGWLMVDHGLLDSLLAGA